MNFTRRRRAGAWTAHHESMVLTGDVSKAVIAWAMSARLLTGDTFVSAFTGDTYTGVRERFRSAALRGMQWLMKTRPPGRTGGWPAYMALPQTMCLGRVDDA